MSLPDLRRQLDSIDDEIICLLQRRAEIASAVGRHKREQGLPFYQPERERQILERIAGRDLGRFPVRSAQAVFREIITACRELQHPTRIAYLGPEGTFTEAAARGFFGEAASLQPQSDFRAVFEAVTARQTDFGLVPVENSTAGAIREVLDLLALHNLTIVGETYFDVHLSLLSRAAELTDVEVIYSKDAALEQCRDWLRANLPAARLEAVASTADGARRAAGQPTAAAIGPEHAGTLYDLAALARGIEDRHDNRTRFFVLGHDPVKPSGQDKTSLLLAVPHKPGALVAALEVLRRHQLNMTLIESRPSTWAAFEYQFYIDIEGHREEPQVAAALDELAGVSLLCQVLGSYPRALT